MIDLMVGVALTLAAPGDSVVTRAAAAQVDSVRRIIFTLPCTQPDTLGPCVDGVFHIPERLADAILRDEAGNELDRHAVNGRECGRDTFIVRWDGSPIQRFVTVTDLAGNESCRHGAALGEWPAAVPPAPTPTPSPAWRITLRVKTPYIPREGWKLYDLRGALVNVAIRPGYYWEKREGLPTQRLLVER